VEYRTLQDHQYGKGFERMKGMGFRRELTIMSLLTAQLILTVINQVIVNGPVDPSIQKVFAVALFIASWLPWFLFMRWTMQLRRVK
jgi:hypothetical protein